MNKPPLDHKHFEEMAWAYVLGALDGEDLAEFQAHLEEGCDLCHVLYPQFKETADLLLLAGDAVTPPPDLRNRVLKAAGVDTAAPAPAPPPAPRLTEVPPRRSGGATLFFALAAAAALAFAVWQTISLNGRLTEAVDREKTAREEIAALRDDLGTLQTRSDEQARLIRLLEDPESGLVTLASLKPAPNASGKVLWDRKGDRGYLWVSNLPQDPDGKDYQLWAIAGGTPVSAGVFSVSAEGSALIPLDRFPADAPVGAFAVTLEPAGGVPAPSGEMMLIGTVSG